jgi:RNA polymerase sigma-70 factor (ECF subfamily)
MSASPEHVLPAQAAGSPGLAPDDSWRRDAFAAEFASIHRPLWMIAFGFVRNSAQADDVLQDAALIALGKLRDFRVGTNFKAWMGRIVRYVAANHVRSIRRRRVADTNLDLLESPGTRPGVDGTALQLGPAVSLSTEQSHFDDQVMHALAELDVVPRTCLLLRTLEELTYAAIADLLGIPEGTAMSHVHRARQYMRARLASPAGTSRAPSRRTSARAPEMASVYKPGRPPRFDPTRVSQSRLDQRDVALVNMTANNAG